MPANCRRDIPSCPRHCLQTHAFVYDGLPSDPMAQMHTLSARLPMADVEWLAAIEIPGATTASDKLRALVARSRHIQESTADFQTSLTLARELVAPLLAEISAFEHR